jgi:hypothetical protein
MTLLEEITCYIMSQWTNVPLYEAMELAEKHIEDNAGLYGLAD